MRVLQCPEFLDVDAKPADEVWVFVGGGISNCPDWQKELIARFKDIDDKLVLINPRREDFDINDPTMSEKQIKWEHYFLQACDAVLFWFPFQTLCPITLYELGYYTASGKPCFVGCHPAYQRKFDVELQTKLARPHIPVVDNFADLVEEIKFWYHN